MPSAVLSWPTKSRDVRQSNVLAWVRRAYGVDSVEQRALRMLEEALEAYRAAGGNQVQALQLVKYVFDRPRGDLAQEIGGVGVTLLSLAAVAQLSADHEEQREFERVLSAPIAGFAARNAEKNAVGLKART